MWRMANEQKEFWSTVAQNYDRVVDLQIGGTTRSMVRERVMKEGRLGELAEFGCGTGFYTRALVAKADRVVATDIAPGMLAVAREGIKTSNVTFQLEDCQATSFPDESFDTAFISLVIHFTQPAKTLAEMRRILKPSGLLIISNLDPGALTGVDRVHCLIRIPYHGITGYRLKPPRGFGKNTMTEKQLCDLLLKSRFQIISTETIKDTSCSSNIPVDYIRAVKV
jgi:ubiquinone/menaquinone biosynthesis C-methylase UbiE